MKKLLNRRAKYKVNLTDYSMDTDMKGDQTSEKLIQVKRRVFMKARLTTKTAVTDIPHRSKLDFGCVLLLFQQEDGGDEDPDQARASGTRKRDSEQFPREDASVGSTERASVSSDVIGGGKG